MKSACTVTVGQTDSLPAQSTSFVLLAELLRLRHPLFVGTK